MPGRKAKPAVSKKQMRFFGAVRSGAVKGTGLTKADAARKMHATKGKKLPEKSAGRKKRK